MDLSKLSDAELEALSAGKMDALSDATLAQISGEPQKQDPSLFSRIKSFASDPRSAMDIARANIAKAGQASPEQIAKERSSPIAGTPPLAMPMAAAPALLQKAAGLMSNTASGRVVGGGVQGAMQGAIDNPGDRASGALKGGLIGGALGAGSEGIAKLLKGGGDVAMQAAVGRKKYTPGVGTTLADEGIAGTKSMMRGQVKRGLENRGSQMKSLTSEADNISIDSAPIASRLREQRLRDPSMGGTLPADAPMLEPGVYFQPTRLGVKKSEGFGELTEGIIPNGPLRELEPPVMGPSASPSDVAKINKANEFISEVGSRGVESPSLALERRMAAGGRAYGGREDPLQSLLGKLSKGEQAAYSDALKSAIPEIAPVDKAYGALARAKSGLEAEPSLPKSLMGMISTGAHVLPGGSLGLSLGGQAATKAGRAAGSINSPVTRSALIDALMGEKKK